MDFNSISRKEFFVLTFSLVGTAAVGAACGSSSSSKADSGVVGAACADPLPETQVADATGHTHTVTVQSATLAATTDQTFTTSAGGTDAHTHMITLTVADLATISGGGQMTVTSTTTDAHTHMFTVSCHAA
jgi:hypothetical protein